MRFSILFLFLGFFIPQQVFSSGDSLFTRNQIHLSYGPGILWAHRPHMAHLVRNNTQTFELDFEHKTKGIKAWQDYYRQPSIGIRLHYGNLGNPNIGSSIGLLPYFNFNLISKGAWELRTAWGIGIGFLTKKFELSANRKHIAIGSNANLFVSINTNLSYHITSDFSLGAKAQFTHFSNAAYALPNLGFNVPSFMLMASWDFMKEAYERPKILELITFLRKHLQIVGGIGLRSASILNEKRYAVYRLSFEYFYRPKFKFALVPSIDLFYNSAIVHRLDQVPESDAFIYNSLGGLALTYHQLVGPVQIYGGMGVYLIDKAKRDGLLYHKLGLRSRLNKKLFMNITLLSHWAKADHLQLGLGYIIK